MEIVYTTDTARENAHVFHLSSMPYNRDIEPISKQLTIVIGLTVVGFMAFGLALSFYRNILFEKTLLDLADQNNNIAKTIEQGYSDLEYFRSAQYKDKYAKENLDKYNPGESVIIITQAPDAPDILENDAVKAERKEAAYQELLQSMPVWDHWKLYLFRRGEIEKLKEKL